MSGYIYQRYFLYEIEICKTTIKINHQTKLKLLRRSTQCHYIICIIKWQMTQHNRIPSLLCSVESTLIDQLQWVQSCRAKQGVKMKMSVFILYAPIHSDTRTIFPQLHPLCHLSQIGFTFSPTLIAGFCNLVYVDKKMGRLKT